MLIFTTLFVLFARDSKHFDIRVKKVCVTKYIILEKIP